MTDELINQSLVPMDDVAGTTLEAYAGRSEVRELAVRLMRLHPAAAEVGDPGMLAVAQLALMVGANPLPGTNEIHVWSSRGRPQVQLGINYDRRKARQLGGVAWQQQPRPMTEEEATEYGVPDHEIGAICSGARRDDLVSMAGAGFQPNDIFRMCGAVGYATVNRQDRAKTGRTLIWTAEKRAEADLLRKLFPNLEESDGKEAWREQIRIMTEERSAMTAEQGAAVVAEGVALLRGTHDEDDPFGMDTPKPIIRATEPPDPVEVDVLDVDPDTGELVGGIQRDHPMRSNPTTGEIVDTAPEPPPAQTAPDNGPDYDDAPPEWFDDDSPSETSEDAEGPTTNGNGHTRPLDGPTVRHTIRKKADWQQGDAADYSDAKRLDSEPITAAQVGAVVGLITDALGSMGKDLVDQTRKEILNYLVGATSTMQLTKKEASAIITWLKELGDGWLINQYAQAEVAAVLNAAGIESGQMELEM